MTVSSTDISAPPAASQQLLSRKLAVKNLRQIQASIVVAWSITPRRKHREMLDRKGEIMPEKETLERAAEDKAEGKAPSTQAGEFVREEIEHVREGKHGARSTKQAIAIGLSKARRAGVELPPPKKGSKKIREQAKRELSQAGKGGKAKKSTKRSRAISKALKKEGHSAASKASLSRQARSAAAKRSAASRSRSAKKAAATRKK